MCIFYISLYVVVFFYSCVNTSVFRISFSLCRSHFHHYMLTILFVFLHHSFISIFQAMRFCLHFLYFLFSLLRSEFILHSFGSALSLCLCLVLSFDLAISMLLRSIVASAVSHYSPSFSLCINQLSV